MMSKSLLFLSGLIVFFTCWPMVGFSEVIITELMYNPDSQETGNDRAEWVEIYNTGPGTVDISNWKLRDEAVTPSSGFPGGTLISPDEAVVIVAPNVTVADFQAAWGMGYQIIQSGTPVVVLGNSPSSVVDVLELIDDSAMTVDEVNYDDSGNWPSDPGGPSIYLLPTALSRTANDSSANWSISATGVDGAFNNTTTVIFDGTDTGSPGIVPEPTGLALSSFGMLTLLTFTRHRHRRP